MMYTMIRRPLRNTDTTRDQSVTIETLSKVAVLLSTLCYIIGLLTVNNYLRQLGVADFSLLSVRFIYTGASVIGFMLIGVGLPALGIWYVQGEAQRALWTMLHMGSEAEAPKPTGRSALVIGTGWLLGFCLLFYLLIAAGVERSKLLLQGDASTGSILSAAFSVYFWGAFDLGLLLLLVISYRRSGFFHKAILLFMFLGVFLYYLGLYAQHIYPAVPEQYGGGQPNYLQLLVNKDDIDGARTLGIPIPASSQLSDPIMILFEGNSTYVLRQQTGAVIQIDKEMVKGIQVVR